MALQIPAIQQAPHKAGSLILGAEGATISELTVARGEPPLPLLEEGRFSETKHLRHYSPVDRKENHRLLLIAHFIIRDY